MLISFDNFLKVVKASLPRIYKSKKAPAAATAFNKYL